MAKMCRNQPRIRRTRRDRIKDGWCLVPRMTQDQVAARLGISRQRVAQEETSAFVKIAAALAAMDRLTLCRRQDRNEEHA
jgi:DNA-directed RNA polymerase sigma subunit (sigma70/sigma32)